MTFRVARALSHWHADFLLKVRFDHESENVMCGHSVLENLWCFSKEVAAIAVFILFLKQQFCCMQIWRQVIQYLGWNWMLLILLSVLNGQLVPTKSKRDVKEQTVNWIFPDSAWQVSRNRDQTIQCKFDCRFYLLVVWSVEAKAILTYSLIHTVVCFIWQPKRDRSKGNCGINIISIDCLCKSRLSRWYGFGYKRVFAYTCNVEKFDALLVQKLRWNLVARYSHIQKT